MKKMFLFGLLEVGGLFFFSFGLYSMIDALGLSWWYWAVIYFGVFFFVIGLSLLIMVDQKKQP